MKQKWCDGTDHSIVLLKYTSSHLLEDQESNCWLRLIKFKRAEKCMALFDVVASIKPKRYVKPLLKRQQWTLDSKESKFCDKRKMNGQRKPMTRYWRPSLRRSRVDLLVATSQFKQVDRWMEIVFYMWPVIRRKLIEDIAEETTDVRDLFFCRV